MVPGSNPPKKSSHHRTKKRVPAFPEFLREAEKLRDTALATLRQNGCHAPIVVAWTHDGVREIIGLGLERCPFSLGEILAMLVKVRGLSAFVCASEAWMTRGAVASLDVMPSQSVDREECLTIAAVHPEGKRMWVYPFAREHGRITLGKLLDSAAEGYTLSGGIPSALGDEEGRP